MIMTRNRIIRWVTIVLQVTIYLCCDYCCNKSSNVNDGFRFGMIGFAAASSPRSYNYNPYQYDMTVPQFTPDGRLLQVEYAQLAAYEQSSPIIVVTVTNDLALICTVRHSTKQRRTTAAKNKKSTTTTMDLNVMRKNKIIQERLIVLSSDSANSNNNDVVLGLSGILSDSLVLLQEVVQNQFMKYIRWYGYDAGIQLLFTAMANIIANQCQSNSFGGGIRPYGSSFVIVNWNANGVLNLHRTDPSGAIQYVQLKNNDSENNVPIYISGGGSDGMLLQRRLMSEWYNNNKKNNDNDNDFVVQQQQPKSMDDDPTTVSIGDDSKNNDRNSNNNNDNSSILNERNTNVIDHMSHILSIIVEEYKKKQKSGIPDNDPNDNDTNTDDEVVWMEAVLLSKTRGVIKLSQKYINQLLILRQQKQQQLQQRK